METVTQIIDCIKGNIGEDNYNTLQEQRFRKVYDQDLQIQIGSLQNMMIELKQSFLDNGSQIKGTIKEEMVNIHKQINYIHGKLNEQLQELPEIQNQINQIQTLIDQSQSYFDTFTEIQEKQTETLNIQLKSFESKVSLKIQELTDIIVNQQNMVSKQRPLCNLSFSGVISQFSSYTDAYLLNEENKFEELLNYKNADKIMFKNESMRTPLTHLKPNHRKQNSVQIQQQSLPILFDQSIKHRNQQKLLVLQDTFHISSQSTKQSDTQDKLTRYEVSQSDSILLNQDHINKLKEWIGDDFQLKLLYRGSRDTFKAKAFHDLCDNQGPTITVILSQHNLIFGGFTRVSWQKYPDKDKIFKSDPSAFIFSLTQGTKHEQYQNEEYALRHNENYLAGFGKHDFLIVNDCNSSPFSGSNIGMTYRTPEGIKPGSEEAQNYLAGSGLYTVKEIETLRVILY